MYNTINTYWIWWTCSCCGGDGEQGGDHLVGFGSRDINWHLYSCCGCARYLGCEVYCPLRPTIFNSCLTICFTWWTCSGDGGLWAYS